MWTAPGVVAADSEATESNKTVVLAEEDEEGIMTLPEMRRTSLRGGAVTRLADRRTGGWLAYLPASRGSGAAPG